MQLEGQLRIALSCLLHSLIDGTDPLQQKLQKDQAIAGRLPRGEGK